MEQISFLLHIPNYFSNVLLKFFLSLACSHRRLIRKYAILCGLWNKNCLRRLLIRPPIGYFFSTFFFRPQSKAKADSFICASFLVGSLACFNATLVITLVRFFVHKFFFVFPQIFHSCFGRLYQSSDALVGGVLWEYG